MRVTPQNLFPSRSDGWGVNSLCMFPLISSPPVVVFGGFLKIEREFTYADASRRFCAYTARLARLTLRLRLHPHVSAVPMHASPFEARPRKLPLTRMLGRRSPHES